MGPRNYLNNSKAKADEKLILVKTFEYVHIAHIFVPVSWCVSYSGFVSDEHKGWNALCGGVAVSRFFHFAAVIARLSTQ